MNLESNIAEDTDLRSLFKLADEIGNKHYHKLTSQDFQDYLQYNYWRYINGDYECGTTEESRIWVSNNSGSSLPGMLTSACNAQTLAIKPKMTKKSNDNRF